MCNVHNRVLMFCGSFGFGSNLAKIDGARYSSSRASLLVSASRIMPLPEEKIRIETGMELIDIYSGTGDLDKSAAIVSVLRKLEPMDGARLYTAYRIYSDLADESLLSLSVVEPKSARMLQALAHELAKRGNTAEAIEKYRAALKIDPRLPGLHFELAEMLSTLSTTEGRQEAESEYKAALEANPLDEQSECRLGDIALRANDLKAASEHYTRAVQLQPGDPEASIGLAKVLMSMDQPQKAEPLLQRTLQLDPTSAVAHFRLSTIEYDISAVRTRRGRQTRTGGIPKIQGNEGETSGDLPPLTSGSSLGRRRY
jgi:tetratricopeptide (TPR) repeat protein